MNNLKCQCGKRIHTKGRELCATCWRKMTPEGKADGSARQRAYQQRIKEHFSGTAAVAVCVLSACSIAYADELPKGFAPSHASFERLGYSTPQAITSPALTNWRGAPPGWNPPGLDGPGRGGGGGRPGTNGKGCKRGKPCRPEPPIPHDPPGAPGPLPVLGAAAAWGWSRRLRQKIAKGNR